MSGAHVLDILGTAALWGAAGATLAWLVTWPARRRSQAGVLLSISLVSTAAAVAAVIGNTRAMFISAEDEYVTVVVAVVAGLIAATAAAVTGRGFARDNLRVQAAVTALREGRIPVEDGRRLTGQLQQLRADLADAARTLAASRDRERTLESSRRELVAWVSHDLRTPLAALRAMAEALEDGLAANPERYHKQIRIEVDRLAAMVDDLFEISRLQAGTANNQSERVNLEDLVSDCVAAIEPVATLQGVRLVGKSSSIAEVVGNGAELNRALTNLLVNAVRHTGAAGTVEITLRAAEKSTNPVAELTVRDQCGGIAVDDLPKIFDVGFRGEPARTPHPGLGGGAGLGLAITHGIVTAHSGSVEVRNRSDGCEFTVRLPLAG